MEYKDYEVIIKDLLKKKSSATDEKEIRSGKKNVKIFSAAVAVIFVLSVAAMAVMQTGNPVSAAPSTASTPAPPAPCMWSSRRRARSSKPSPALGG